jgi:hypothetical protein
MFEESLLAYELCFVKGLAVYFASWNKMKISRGGVVSAYWFNWVQRDSTQETLISENRVFIQTHSHGIFLWILRPVPATLASQESLRPSPKSRSPCDIFSVDGGGVTVPQGILTAAFSAGPVHGSPGTPSGHREKGHAQKQQLPLHQGLGWTLTAWSPMGEEASKALGSGLSLFTMWWPHHFCYSHCHLRVGLFSCQPVTLLLASKS